MPLRRPNLLDAFRRVSDPGPPPAGGAGSVPPATTQPGAPRPSGAPLPRAPAGPAPREAAPESAPAPQPLARSAPRALGAAPSAVPAPSPLRSDPPRSDPPRSDPPRSDPPRSDPPRSHPPAGLPSSPPKERLVLLALAIAVAVLVLVMLLRPDDAGASAVQAQDVAPAVVAPTPPAPAATRAGDVARTPHDAALHDPKNRYTVRLIQYPNDDKGLAFALEAHRWLVKLGYPVGSPIRLGSGKGIVLVASAKPSQEELVPLRDNLRRLRYPESSKTMPFSDAYIGEIDHVLAR